ncbi:hypothetical protein BJ875DRAFT_272355 [Amylocarpus encephaloides]|uniref:Glutamyl-tRNA synthetase n=1 Tax=Amylocarpus encephaloides TaxID=45428 RepID=A0A9P7YKE5_9HELO|nr:hypothetical protein BJ875DRAFT_272355 [Amylocarpus encephaloides]
MAATNFKTAISIIDMEHAKDPTKKSVKGQDSQDTTEVPYELYYAQQMTHYLSLREPNASPILHVAIRAQHFRRWDTPRDSYPKTREGYLKWRFDAKNKQADETYKICKDQCDFTEEEAKEVAALIKKKDLKKNVETQILEDVACLVFLDDQFAQFEEDLRERDFDERKIINIVQKTWGKMSEKGHELALQISMDDKCKELIGKALAG